MKPYISLGIYNPPRWNAWLVGHDLTNITKEFELVAISDPKHRHQRGAWRSRALCAYVRRRTVRNRKATSFHQDGDLAVGSQMDNCLVLWSSNSPTELRVGTTVYKPKHREVILFRNLACFHRRPPECPRIRWLFRQRVEIPLHIQLP